MTCTVNCPKELEQVQVVLIRLSSVIITFVYYVLLGPLPTPTRWIMLLVKELFRPEGFVTLAGPPITSSPRQPSAGELFAIRCVDTVAVGSLRPTTNSSRRRR